MMDCPRCNKSNPDLVYEMPTGTFCDNCMTIDEANNINNIRKQAWQDTCKLLHEMEKSDYLEPEF